MLNLRGVIVPIATPMNESGDIDPIGTAKLLTYVITGGVSGIFANLLYRSNLEVRYE